MWVKVLQNCSAPAKTIKSTLLISRPSQTSEGALHKSMSLGTFEHHAKLDVPEKQEENNVLLLIVFEKFYFFKLKEKHFALMQNNLGSMLNNFDAALLSFSLDLKKKDSGWIHQKYKIQRSAWRYPVKSGDN